MAWKVWGEREREYQREYRKKNRKRANEWKKGYRRRNRKKVSKYNKEYYQKNREDKIKKQKRWSKNNSLKIRYYEYRRRMRANGTPLGKGNITKTMEVRIATKLQEQDFKCLYCGINIEKDFTLDHIIPLSRGGGNGISNIDLVCRSCNSSKGTKTKEEYLGVLEKEKVEHQEQLVLE